MFFFHQNHFLTISYFLWQIHTYLSSAHESKRRYLERYNCVDGCQKLSTSTEVVHVSQWCEELIMQLNIFKCMCGISKKLSISEEISFVGNRMLFTGIIYHEGKQSLADIIHLELMWIILRFCLVIQEFY